MKTKFEGHTLGWAWEDSDGKVYLSSDDGKPLFKTFSRYVSDEDRELMRAAPDLLRVAIELAEALERNLKSERCPGGPCVDAFGTCLGPCQKTLAAFHALVDPKEEP